MALGNTLYDRAGGSEGLDRLVAEFIRIICSEPGLDCLREVYAQTDLEHYAGRLKEFLSGWLGGPPIYLERHGMPMLREGHSRLVITEEAMLEWMQAMRTALAAVIHDREIQLKLEGAFSKMAASLVNA